MIFHLTDGLWFSNMFPFKMNPGLESLLAICIKWGSPSLLRHMTPLQICRLRDIERKHEKLFFTPVIVIRRSGPPEQHTWKKKVSWKAENWERKVAMDIDFNLLSFIHVCVVEAFGEITSQIPVCMFKHAICLYWLIKANFYMTLSEHLDIELSIYSASAR